MMVMKYSYHETGWSDTLERTFQQPAKPMSPAVVGAHLGDGEREENGFSCFCANGCGFGFNVQIEPALQAEHT